MRWKLSSFHQHIRLREIHIEREGFGTMRIAVISFTKNGSKLGQELIGKLYTGNQSCIGYQPIRYWEEGLKQFGIYAYDGAIADLTKRLFSAVDALIFIGAAGIAVRAIASCIKDKYSDPAVLVIDEKGQHVISLLSGHVGGANELAVQIAELTDGNAVITTASEVNGIEAIDVWAKKHDLIINSRDTARRIAAAILDGRKIIFSVDDELKEWWESRSGDIPDGCVQMLENKRSKPVGFKTDVGQKEYQVRITCRSCLEDNILCVSPKIICLGIGCRKNIAPQIVKQAVVEIMKEYGFSFTAIKSIASIDLKQEEPGILELAKEAKLPYFTYSADQLTGVLGVFSESDFVKRTTGVGNVCERAACRAADNGSGAKLLLKKQMKDGVTLALAMPMFGEASSPETDTSVSLVIFGGTTEGRLLAEWAVSHGIRTLMSVATAYGEEVLNPHRLLTVRKGRLDADGMHRLLQNTEPSLVLDATHPYAVEVTKTLQDVCRDMGKSYIRIIRESQIQNQNDDSHVVYVGSAQEAADYLKGTEGKIFLTTGSKELPIFAEDQDMLKRLIARVLPSESVIQQCSALGITGKQLIAMQGPFSFEMNLAMFRSSEAEWMVTKESGINSGFHEKMEAACYCGIKPIVIGRPSEERGISLEAVKEILRRQFDLKQEKSLEEHERKIVLIGLGMGNGNQLTQEAMLELKECQVIFGAERMLEAVRSIVLSVGSARNTQMVAMYQGDKICDYLAKHREYKKAAVIFSGDTGYHSGAKGMITAIHKHFPKEVHTGMLKLRICPGISTVSALCARFETDWTELYLASAHGTDCDVIGLLKKHKRVFLLLGGNLNLAQLCRSLKDDGYGEKVWVQAGFRLGYEDERLLEGLAGHLTDIPDEKLAAVILRFETADTIDPSAANYGYDRKE